MTYNTKSKTTEYKKCKPKTGSYHIKELIKLLETHIEDKPKGYSQVSLDVDEMNFIIARIKDW